MENNQNGQQAGVAILTSEKVDFKLKLVKEIRKVNTGNNPPKQYNCVMYPTS
jgi:hypothetical protein